MDICIRLLFRPHRPFDDMISVANAARRSRAAFFYLRWEKKAADLAENWKKPWNFAGEYDTLISGKSCVMSRLRRAAAGVARRKRRECG